VSTTDPVEPLIADLVAWVAKEERPYLEVMEAWRTSCPRLPVWEEANARGLVTRARGADGVAIVRVTEAGRDFLTRRTTELSRIED
jgi:D-3-phosphoglycerate dehydrogenase